MDPNSVGDGENNFVPTGNRTPVFRSVACNLNEISFSFEAPNKRSSFASPAKCLRLYLEVDFDHRLLNS